MDRWEKTCDDVMIQVLVLAHLVDFLPLLVCHLFLDGLSGHFVSSHVFTTKLEEEEVKNVNSLLLLLQGMYKKTEL